MVQIRVGVAGWSVPAALAEHFRPDGSHLERYASRFDAVEINSSFHRPHRRTTYARWAASVPAGFRFSVKLPRAITHERRFVDCADMLLRFAEEVDGLGEKRGPVLVQLPPSFAWSGALAAAFFEQFHAIVAGDIVCEPRHASWFTAEAEAMFRELRVARVAADPAPVPEAAKPGGWDGMAYFRLHGSPRVYRSAYGPSVTGDHAQAVAAVAARGAQVWAIYDNTAAGAAPADASALLDRLAQPR